MNVAWLQRSLILTKGVKSLIISPQRYRISALRSHGEQNSVSIPEKLTSYPQTGQHQRLQGLRRQIFCNVELNCANIEAVGFDMDFTLAQYNEAFDLLAFEGSKKKLVSNLGYPEEILNFRYSADRFRRGLIIDKRRGNTLKIDRHKYVRKAYHGSRELSTEERKRYNKQVSSFTESNFICIDTIFTLVDAVLFNYLVDYKDEHPDIITKTYEQLYADVRESVDICHRDGVIKDTVRDAPEEYIVYDENLVPMLQKLKLSGKKVFLLTNSLWEYTDAVMTYLVHGGSLRVNGDIHWKDLFDLIIVGANKPDFLQSEFMSIFQVEDSGTLHNIEDKDSITMESLEKNKVFQGGCWQDLHRMLNVSFGDGILYVGDHMYADILRSKRTLGWRTCLVVPELENELEVQIRERSAAQRIENFGQLQNDLDEYIDLLRLRQDMGVEVSDQLEEAEKKALVLKEEIRREVEDYNRKFNPYWGQLFKAGRDSSRFAKQITEYACLYTSRASNLRFINPQRPFRPVQDFMAHDALNAINYGGSSSLSSFYSMQQDIGDLPVLDLAANETD